MLDIPSEWIEEPDEGDACIYYEDGPHSGGLRVRAATYRGDASQKADVETVAGLLLGMVEQILPTMEHEVALLPDGRPLVFFLQPFPEDDPPIVMASWLAGRVIFPHIIEIVSFNYTALLHEAGLPQTRAHLQLLDNAVRTATYTEIESSLDN